MVTVPTCTEKGYTTHTCSRCGDAYTDTEVAALGHTEGAEANCRSDQTCTVCGTVLTEKLGHDYKAVVTAPTCTEKGYPLTPVLVVAMLTPMTRRIPSDIRQAIGS